MRRRCNAPAANPGSRDRPRHTRRVCFDPQL